MHRECSICDIRLSQQWLQNTIFCRYRLYETVYNKKDSRFGPSPIFGSNCGVVQTGTLSVGDIVTI